MRIKLGFDGCEPFGITQVGPPNAILVVLRYEVHVSAPGRGWYAAIGARPRLTASCHGIPRRGVAAAGRSVALTRDQRLEKAPAARAGFRSTRGLMTGRPRSPAWRHSISDLDYLPGRSLCTAKAVAQSNVELGPPLSLY